MEIYKEKWETAKGNEVTAELSYLSWERGPAIIGLFPEEGVTKAFFIPVGGSDWIKASGGQYGDIGENGGLLTKEEFENTFGVIGETLPELP